MVICQRSFSFLIVVLLLAASVDAKQKSSQAAPANATGIDEIVEKMKIQLELTDKQVSQVKAIIEHYLDEEKRLKLEEKRQLAHVLTGEQMYTWNFLQNEQSLKKKH